MPADSIVAREIGALREELLAARRERGAGPGPDPHADAPVEETEEQRELRRQLTDLAEEMTTYFEDAGRPGTSHATQNVIGAMLVGFVVGRFFGRR